MVQPYPQQYPPMPSGPPYPQQGWTHPQSYQQQPPQQQQHQPKEIPITLVIAAVIVVWMFIMGSAIGYVLVAPCSFLKSVVGDENLAKLQDQNNLEAPCTFEKDSFSCGGPCSGRPTAKCMLWKLDVNEGCRQFIIEATTK